MMINADTLKAIHDDGFEFGKFFVQYVEGAFAKAALKPTISVQRLHEAHGAWRNDLDRVGTNEKNLDEGLDHFKQAGHLAFWLRRFCPITDALCSLDGASPSVDNERWRKFLFSYSNEYIAFLIGFNISQFYERFKSSLVENPRAFEVSVRGEYMNMICHFLKYKTVSPHALTVIYKSLFLPS